MKKDIILLKIEHLGYRVLVETDVDVIIIGL